MNVTWKNMENSPYFLNRLYVCTLKRLLKSLNVIVLPTSDWTSLDATTWLAFNGSFIALCHHLIIMQYFNRALTFQTFFRQPPCAFLACESVNHACFNLFERTLIFYITHTYWAILALCCYARAQPHQRDEIKFRGSR